jgi:hypothetical protein
MIPSELSAAAKSKIKIKPHAAPRKEKEEKK